MKAEDLFAILVPVTFVVFLVTERLFSRRQYPPCRFWTLIGFVFLVITGLIATLMPLLLPLFQRWNVRTPRWIGYFIQRPESHGLHHEFGIHGRNYSDFPLWDMLMGTFVNPETFDGRVGFDGDAESHVAAMILFQDVNRR